MSGKSLVRITATALVLVSMSLGSARGADSRATDDAIKRWASGPVRYLMTFHEEQAVSRLRSIPDLGRFISDFWARRDPSPGTFQNEFRRIYWDRVLQADQRFRDSTTPGWKTDRGRIFILLGAPDDVQTDESPNFSAGINSRKEVAGSSAAWRGLERWTYLRRNSRLTDAEFIVAFVRDGSLDWKLSTDASLIGPNFPGTVTTDASDSRFGGLEGVPAERRNQAAAGQGAPTQRTPQQAIAALSPALDTSLFANYDLGLETSFPSAAEAVIATVTAREFLSAFPAKARFEFFRAEDGSTFVDIGALIKADELYPPGVSGRSALRVYASVTPAGDAGQPRYATNDLQPQLVETAKGPPAGGLYDVWTGLALKAGRYRITLAIEDSLTGRIGRTASDLEVPDFSRPGLALSTLVLASELSDAGGRLGVKARASGTYRRTESLGIYYEVYGLPGGASPHFTTSYRFFRETDGSPLLPIGKPIRFDDRTGAAQGWTFPLAKWPVGRYRMEVTVTGPDNVSASSQVAFEVVE